jgi:hypothetical protein
MRQSWSTTFSTLTRDYVGSLLQLFFPCSARPVVTTIYNPFTYKFPDYNGRCSASIIYPLPYSTLDRAASRPPMYESSSIYTVSYFLFMFVRRTWGQGRPDLPFGWHDGRNNKEWLTMSTVTEAQIHHIYLFPNAWKQRNLPWMYFASGVILYTYISMTYYKSLISILSRYKYVTSSHVISSFSIKKYFWKFK